MGKTVRATVKPELIHWVREDAGLSLEDVAKKTGTTVERVRNWETGDLAPTIRQLRLLGRAARRPLAVFFLSEPPKRFQAMHDYRRMPGDPLAEGTREFRLEIRAALARREIAVELAEELGEPSTEFPIRLSLEEDAIDAAFRLREALGIKLGIQRTWRSPYDALNGWKRAIEDLGALVFQASGVDVSEMRGFSIAEFPFPAVVVNVQDSPRARVFSLIHELCHIGLRRGGVCDLTDPGQRPPEEDRVEVFCNAVAAEVLVPINALVLSGVVQEHGSDPEWTMRELQILSTEFSVSREVILRRLLTAGRTTKKFYREKREEFLEEYRALRRKQTGFVTPDVKAVSGAGPTFVKLVLDSYYQERITSRDVSEYLGVRLKHLASIEEKVMGGRILFA
jgi:Zn-dependent peptidase ImmA (M78 family)